MTSATSGGPLAGIRVLDLGRMFAAPWAGQMLGDLGADVIKVERLEGDEMRGYGPPFLQDRNGGKLPESAFSIAANRNKRSVSIDFTRPEGADIVRRLVATCHIVLENFRPGTLERHGLDRAALRALRPGLIHLSITGFGRDGEHAGRPAVDTMVQAMSGMMSLSGEPDGEPQRAGFVIADLIAGMYAVIGALAALRSREVANDNGQDVEVALLDSAFAALSHRVHEYLLTAVAPTRTGAGSRTNVPSGHFAASDGTLSLNAGGEAQFRKLCRALAREDLLSDPRFTDRAGRAAHRAALNEILEAILGAEPVDHWVELLQAHGVFCAPIRNIAQALEAPPLRDRAMRVSVPHQAAREVEVVANPLRFSQTPIRYTRAPPLPGEHTREVLREIGIDNAAAEALFATGVIR